MLKYEHETIISKENEMTTTLPTKSKSKQPNINTMLDETVALMNQRKHKNMSIGTEAQNWFALVQTFRSKVEKDQGILNRHEVAGRAILYSQLADAYKIGLELVNDKYLAAISSLLHHHSIAGAKKAIDVARNNRTDREWNAKNPDAIQRELKEEISPWVQVVKLLYGKWIDTTKMTATEKKAYAKAISIKGDLNQFATVKNPADEAKSVYQEWLPNRSAEKYAVVFRYMHDNGITPEDVASYIDTFNVSPYGTKLLGIERAGRAAANAGKTAKPESKEVIDKRNEYVARAEARKNWNVFAVEKPNTFPSKFTYARAVLKQEGDELVIIVLDDAAKPMEESAYVNLAVKLGKPLLDKENEQAAERQAALDAVKPQAMQSMNYLAGSDKLAALVADGDDAAEIDAEIQALLDRRAARLAGTKALEEFADMEPANGR